MKKSFLCMLIPVLICFTSCSKSPETIADKVIYGNFITMDSANPTAGAVAIKDGEILALGDKDSINKYIGEKTSKDNLEGKYIYPGFVDAHTHYAVMTSLFAGGTVIDREKEGEYEMGDYAAYGREVKKFVDANPDKEVYQAFGMWVVGNPPTAQMLDSYIPTNKPIVIIGAGGHDCWLNTPALKRFVGNFEGTEEEKEAVDAWIKKVGKECVETGTKDGLLYPKGYFCETARFRITDQIPHDKELIKETIKGLDEMTLGKGYTTVGDCTIVENDLNKQVTAFKELDANNELKLKYRSYYEIREYDDASIREAELNKAIALAEETKDGDHFKVVGIKIFLDGVYEAISAYTFGEYPPEAQKGEGYRGIGRWKNMQNELNEIVYKANKAGLALEFHAMGDAAVRQALDACEYAAEKLNVSGTPNFRNAISHLGFIDRTEKDKDGLSEGLTDIERFAKLGVTAVVAPQWSSANASIYPQETKCLGSTKVDEMYLIKSIIETGANVAFHTDGATMGGVPEMIYDAVTRRDATHEDAVLKVRAPEERITGEQSLKCLTTNAAYTVKSEDELGCIKVGMKADFSVYNKDYRDNEIAKKLETFNEAELSSLYVNGVDLFAK